MLRLVGLCKTEVAVNQAVFFKTMATEISLEMICQDGLSANRKKVTRYSWICMLSLVIFILVLALPVTLCHLVKFADDLWFWFLIWKMWKLVRWPPMPCLALKFSDARNMVCPSMKSQWADLGNCFMPVNLFHPHTRKWSVKWFHIVNHEYIFSEPLLHCLIKTKCICVWDETRNKYFHQVNSWDWGCCVSNLFGNLALRGWGAKRGSGIENLFVMVWKAVLLGNHTDWHTQTNRKNDPFWLLYFKAPGGILTSVMMRATEPNLCLS